MLEVFLLLNAFWVLCVGLVPARGISCKHVCDFIQILVHCANIKNITQIPNYVDSALNAPANSQSLRSHWIILPNNDSNFH
jgi:hypothetical protein